MRRSGILAAALTVALSLPVMSETVVTEAGGDTFAAGETLVRTLDADRDVFAAGRSTTVLGKTQGDMHDFGLRRENGRRRIGRRIRGRGNGYHFWQSGEGPFCRRIYGSARTRCTCR